METKKIIIICVIILVLIIISYFYFTDFGHTNLFNDHKLMFSDKVIYVGSENMPSSEEGIQYTLSCWIRVNNLYLNTKWDNGTSNYKTIIDNNGSPNILYLINENVIRIQLVYYNENRLTYYNFDLENIELQKWINITITVDNKLVNIYKNGIIYISKELLNPNLRNYKLMSIGEKYNNFNGYIGYIDYYNYVLSPEKINSIYNKNYSNHPNILPSYESVIASEKNDEIKTDLSQFKNFLG